MGYLRLDQTLDMNKVTISLWFRIPSETIALVNAAAPKFYWDYRVMVGVIPLLTWGPGQSVTTADYASVYLGEFTTLEGRTESIYGTQVVGSHPSQLSPSFIGVRIPDDPGKSPTLDVHIQTKDHPTCVGIKSVNPGFHVTGGRLVMELEDSSFTEQERMEYFGNSDADTSRSTNHPAVVVDKWNHVLISWELLAHNNMESSGGKMWCAINDVNMKGDDLPAIRDEFSGMGSNDHMAALPYRFHLDDVPISINPPPDTITLAPPSVDLTVTAIPSFPFSIPAPPSVSYTNDAHGAIATRNPVEKVEMAELQIFTGVTLDTSNEQARRAFINWPDPDNVSDEDKVTHNGMQPVDPEKAEKHMGKRPEILLHGSSDWEDGKNTGSLGINSEGKIIPSGQFRRTGTIVAWEPDPELGKGLGGAPAGS